MPPQQLLLSWKDHNGALVSIFENLLKKNTLVDCTLAAEGQYLKAHKVVLSACSSYFELLFSQESEKNPIVILKDVEFQELEAAVKFMYRGEVEVQEDRLAVFLEVAESLQIKGLGSDRKTQSSKEKSTSSSVISSSAKIVRSPRQQSKKDSLSSSSARVDQIPNIPADCELVRNNESSSVRQLSQSESSRSSPSLPLSTSLSQNRQNVRSDQDNLENSQSSSTTLPQFSAGENEQSVINHAIKIEPVTDTYDEEKSEDAHEDFGDDVIMMDDQEDWDEDNVETMNDEHPTHQQDLGFTSEHMKIEGITSGNAEGVQSGNLSSSEGANWIQQEEGQNFSTIFVKDEPSTSTSWSHQEAYAGGESGPSAGTSAASTGPEYVLPDVHYTRQSARSSAQFYQQGTTGSPHNIHEVKAESDDSSSQPDFPEQPQIQEHKCPYCNYMAVTSITLITHLRTHAGERPYKCPYCKYRTMKSSDVAKHIRIHTGEKPYQCSECDYKTIEVTKLIRHRRRHTGEKPYKCSLCDYRATQSGTIHRHIRNIHSKTKTRTRTARKSKWE